MKNYNLKSKIKSIKAREILDSRGNFTVEVDLVTDQGLFQDSVPSGVSKGKYEAVVLEPKKAIKNVNEIIGPKLKGKDPSQQKKIDSLMIKLDGTENKSKLGANAIVAVSMATCRAGAAAQNFPLWKYIAQIFGTKKPILPIPSVLLIEGGAHAGNDLDFQEFMIAPEIKPYSKALQAASEIYHTLKEILKKNFGRSATNVGDEGGFAPPIRFPEEALDLIQEAIKRTGYYKDKIKFILDVAASQFFETGKYKTKFGIFTSKKLLSYYLDLIEKYPIIGLEDPFSEEDWEGWKLLSSKFKVQSSKLLIIGDDLLVTNPRRIKEAYQKKACNSLLLKVNQIGTVSEAIEAAKLAQNYGWEVMVSQRGGETCDSFYADLCVGLGTGWIKTGAPARGERVAKYNRLLRIEEELFKTQD